MQEMFPKEAELIRENAERLGIDNMNINVWDASVYMERYRETADVLLLDVPCSGLGVMNRKKDIRYRVTREDLDSLTALQHKIVDACWQYVKPGESALYSTCRNWMENEDMVSYIIENYPLKQRGWDGYIPEALAGGEARKGQLQLFCGEKDTDGFFMAKIRRKYMNER